MLSIYNTYKSLILESADENSVMDAINNHYRVNITYSKGDNDPNSGVKRYCEVYNLGTTSKGNRAIRVYQIYGPDGYKWKTFLIENITGWEPTRWQVKNPISDTPGYEGPNFNPYGDKSLNNGNLQVAKFDNKSSYYNTNK